MKLLLRGIALVAIWLLQTAVGDYSDSNGLRGNEFESDVDLDRNLMEECVELPSFDDSAAPPETVLSFFALGAIPQSYDDRFCLNGQLRHIDLKYDPTARLLFHLGDSLYSSTCDDKSFYKIANMFTHYRNSRAFDAKDTFFLLGDKEWNGCNDKEKAFQNWVNILGPKSTHEFGTVSDEDITVERQTGVYRPGKVERIENFSVLMNNTLFVGCNVVGGGKTGDENVRLKQNFDWIAQEMRKHKKEMKACVILGHSSLTTSSSKRNLMGTPIKDLLRKEFRRLPILYVHESNSGETGFCVAQAGSKTPNYYSVRLDKGVNAPPVKISVLRSDKTYKFHIDQRGGPYGEEGCPRVGKNTWETDFEDVPKRPVLFTPKLFTFGRKKKPEMLGLCQGICVSDEECEGDLICYRRTGDRADKPVPGCLDEGGGKSGKNYCVKRGSPHHGEDLPALVAFKKKKPYLPLQICEGDCSDSTGNHCDEGLVCHRPVNLEYDVPGCGGKPEHAVDYCIEPPPPQRCPTCIVLLDVGISEEFVEKVGPKIVELMNCKKMSCVKKAKEELDQLRVEANSLGLKSKQKKTLKQYFASELAQKRQELVDAAKAKTATE